MPLDLHERLTAWRKKLEQSNAAAQHISGSAAASAVLRTLKILLWLLGLGTCLMLAWRGTGESVIVTGMIMLVPCAAWRVFGLSQWGLILPISLLAALAIAGALRLS